MDWQLEIEDGLGDSHRLPLEGEEHVIGRSASAAIRLDLPTVSRRHAMLKRSGAGWAINDLGSRSGTVVNGELIDQAALSPGDEIQISRFTLRLIGRQDDVTVLPGTTSTWSSEPRKPDISTLMYGAPPKVDLSHIAALSAFGRSLMDLQDPAERLSKLCETVTGSVLEDQHALALRVVPDDLSRPPVILGSSPADLTEREDVHISRTTISAMCERGVAVLASNFSNDADVVEMSIVTSDFDTAVVACPLSEGPESWDVLYVMLAPHYATTEWLAIVSLAAKEYQQAEAGWRERAAVQERAAIERDLTNARSIQRSILPGDTPIDGLDIAWSAQPCEKVGGDHLDVLPLPDGRVLVMIADVSGHGLPSALATLSVHSVVHTSMKSGMTTEQMMVTLNDHLCAYLPLGRFVTMFVAVVQPETGKTHAISAGHDPPIIVAGDGSPRHLSAAHHMVLGVQPSEFDSEADTLHPGDTVLLFTDGLTELRKPDGDMLHTTGLTEFVTANQPKHADAKGLMTALRSEIDRLQHGSPALDDQTFMFVRKT